MKDSWRKYKSTRWKDFEIVYKLMNLRAFGPGLFHDVSDLAANPDQWLGVDPNFEFLSRSFKR